MNGVADLVSALARLGADSSDHGAWSAVVGFCRSRWEIPAALVVAYLAMVYVTRHTIAQHRYSRAVDRCFAMWNLGLSLFSTWGVWHMSKGLHSAVRSEGLFFSVCADTRSIMRYAEGSAAPLALALFCLSKVPELGDTVFLILKRRPVRLLQWYHHATVMLFCWGALATEYTPGVWFAATNYFVHSVMYMYFFLMTFKGVAKVVKPIAPLITAIQIIQMVWGLIVNGIAVTSYFLHGTCQIQSATVYSAVVMYASYFVLFSKLFIDSRRSSKQAGRGLVRTLSRKMSQEFLDASSSDEDEKAQARKKLN